MSADSTPRTINRKISTHNKNICNAFGCCKNATEKINVSAGTFGIISLDLCNDCVRKFVQKDKGMNIDR
jgi:hypothetical protein